MHLVAELRCIGNYNCSSGFRGGSTVLIEFNSRKYYVEIKSSQCKDFDTNKIKLFYDKEKDEVFERSEVTIRHIVLYLVLFSVLVFGFA